MNESNDGEGVGVKDEKSGFGVGKAMQPNEKYKRDSKTEATNNAESKKAEDKAEQNSAEQTEPKPQMDKGSAYELYKTEDGKELCKALLETTST